MSQNSMNAQPEEGLGSSHARPHFAKPSGRLDRGFYIARRVSWIPNSGWTIVMVREPMNDPDGSLQVFEPGAAKSDPLGKWVFGARVAGFENLPDYPSH